MNNDISKMAEFVSKLKGIDTSIGIFLNDDKSINVSDTFKETAKKISSEEAFSYINHTLSEKLKCGIEKWLNLNKYNVPYEITATMGATGALSHLLSFDRNIKKKQILIPDLSWSNYDNIAMVEGYDVIKYKMFNDNKDFNLRAFENALRKISFRKGFTVIILNYPAHNPTGYTITKKELSQITKIINKYHTKRHRLKVVFDIAYYEYGNFEPLLSSFKRSIDKYFVYSFSKSMGLYGIRVGFLIYFNHNKDKLKKFVLETRLLSRTKWGSCNSMAINTLEKILDDDKAILAVRKELENNKNILAKRALTFTEGIKGYDIYPYKDGFYITVKEENPNALLDFLIKNNIFPVQVEKGVRFVIARMNIEEIQKVTKMLELYYLK